MKQTDNCSEDDKWERRRGGRGGERRRYTAPSSVAGSRAAALQSVIMHVGAGAVRLQVLRLWLAELYLRRSW